MSFRKQALLLFMVVLLASALRLWNYGYDPLHGGQPRSGDVSKKISMSMRVARGDFRPRNYNHPYYLGYSTGLFLKMLPGTIKSTPLRSGE